MKMNKMRYLAIALALTLVCVVFSACGNTGQGGSAGSGEPAASAESEGAAADESAPADDGTVYEIKYATGFLGEKQVEVTNAWIHMLEVKSGGRLIIKNYTDETLLTQTETYDGIVAGIADLGGIWSADLEGIFLANDVFCMPAMVSWPGAAQTAMAHMQLYDENEFMQTELPDVHFMWIDYADPTQINTVNKPIRTMEDLKGLQQIEIGNYVAVAMENMGTTPVNFPPSEIYDALSKGVADGLSVNWNALEAIGFFELINYSTECSLAQPGYYVHAMNQQTWDSLPADLQELLDSAGRDFGMILSWARDLEDMSARENMDKKIKDAGNGGIYVLPEDELARWREASMPVTDEWKSRMADAGLDGDALYEQATAALAENLWSDEFDAKCAALVEEWKAL